jgi:uncharacterized protein YcfJ
VDKSMITGIVIGGIAMVVVSAGAAGGAYVGNQAQKNMQQKDVVTTTERRCTTVNETSQKLVGYDVTYRLGGNEAAVRTSTKPGPTLPVRDGQVVISW